MWVDREEESEEDLKHVCLLNCFVMNLKDSTEGTQLYFSNFQIFKYKCFNLFVENDGTQLTEQSNSLAHVIQDGEVVFTPFIALQSFPSMTYICL